MSIIKHCHPVLLVHSGDDAAMVGLLRDKFGNDARDEVGDEDASEDGGGNTYILDYCCYLGN